MTAGLGVGAFWTFCEELSEVCHVFLDVYIDGFLLVIWGGANSTTEGKRWKWVDMEGLLYCREAKILDFYNMHKLFGLYEY